MRAAGDKGLAAILANGPRGLDGLAVFLTNRVVKKEAARPR